MGKRRKNSSLAPGVVCMMNETLKFIEVWWDGTTDGCWIYVKSPFFKGVWKTTKLLTHPYLNINRLRAEFSDAQGATQLSTDINTRLQACLQSIVWVSTPRRYPCIGYFLVTKKYCKIPNVHPYKRRSPIPRVISMTKKEQLADSGSRMVGFHWRFLSSLRISGTV